MSAERTIELAVLAAVCGTSIWAQWCAIRRAEDLACKLAVANGENKRLRNENARLRAELGHAEGLE